MERAVTDILHRVELHGTDQGREVMVRNFLPWCGEQLKQGRELVVEARLLDDDITEKQRAFFHAVVLEEFHLYARTNGVQYPREIWKAYLKERFLGFKVVTSVDPTTGKTRRLRHRVSTESLGIRRYAQFVDECIAFAATDCGFEVSEPLPPELRGTRRRALAIERGDVDADTGEIHEEEHA
jgi:hypothetical protein